MAAHHTAAPVSSETLTTAQKGWQNFTRGAAIGVIGVIGVIAGLAAVASLGGWM